MRSYCNSNEEGMTNHLLFNCLRFKNDLTDFTEYLFEFGLTAPFNLLDTIIY